MQTGGANPPELPPPAKAWAWINPGNFCPSDFYRAIFEGSVMMSTREEFAACERSDRRLRLLLGNTMMESAWRLGIVLVLVAAAALLLTFLA